MPSKVELRAVSKSFRQNGLAAPALLESTLFVREGEFLCLVGPSGCGKTTLLNIIAGLETPTSGGVFIDGKPVKGPGQDRMMMFQESALFPWRTALGNVLFGLEFLPHLSKEQRLLIAREHLALVGLAKFEKHFVHQLSGGMKQRVALARALAPNPRILLMDEPFAALDAMTREQLYQDLQRICARFNKTVFFVTHNVREAACLADRVAVFSPHPGRITDCIAVEIQRPRDINDAAVSAAARKISEAIHAAQHPETVWQEPLLSNASR